MNTTAIPATREEARAWDMEPQEYLVWSNDHRGWWGPHRVGYMGIISAAGRYSLREAMQICHQANHCLDPSADPNEVLVLAPECLKEGTRQ